MDSFITCKFLPSRIRLQLRLQFKKKDDLKRDPNTKKAETFSRVSEPRGALRSNAEIDSLNRATREVFQHEIVA
ncbi:hypothetical protein C4D60_Mb08t28260 [Musa balbisiana]|uniref:Uncharacterized protein n=1 Tax=Musa balbisiana TaxID=52838 RepID=A0A4S8K757_MUSBA|nr:hypothetical protein C4D60_Mb08t28260 [Musa balbisiana]